MLTAILVAAMALSGAGEGEPMVSQSTHWGKGMVEAFLNPHRTAHPFPELAQADPRAVIETPRGQALHAWATSAPHAIPALTYTDFRLFKNTGDRDAFQKKYFDRREYLTRAALAAWLEPEDPDHLARVNDLIWSICEETTWVLPAHEGPEWNIDLFSAETASQLAYVVVLLGDRLPGEVQERIYREVDRRVFTNYLERHLDAVNWWYRGDGNWSGVCAGSIGEAALVLEKDPARQAEILAIALGTLDRYIENGFEDDGGCLEGAGYWGYGLLHLVSFSKMLEARTGGELDLLSHPKLKLIARYPLSVSMGNGAVASFADSGEKIVLAPCVSAPIAAKTGVDELLAMTEARDSWRLSATLGNLLWWDGKQPGETALTDVFMPASGIARLVGAASGKDIVLVAKGGHNYEPHNHNDLGSFVVKAGGTIYLCDPGSGLYTKAYFDERRYENLFTRSYGHSVPCIGGHEQPLGREYQAAIEKTGEKTIQIDLTKAYAIEELTAAVRTFTMNPGGSITMTGAYRFAGDGLEVQEAFMTWQDVEIDGNVARIVAEDGTLELTAGAGAFAVERFEEECLTNKKAGVLKRISVTYPAAPHMQHTFEMTWVPSPPR